ncbi:MBL fold metallo-hydrolase [Burkholderia sp. 22PA0106]|uniref:MBL fold metallo-hydrolase n=1 Tax=Burkholderia sp. 22PA0106 TaxID=3237371 RepID=UPI0039C298D0
MRFQSDAPVFLKPSIKMELLLDRWLAWPHLVPPVQYAMNLAFRYLPAMQSFVGNPKMHVAASSDPAMFGGPFMDLPEAAAPEIARVLEETKARSADLIRFANDFKAFDRLLQEEASGYSLDGLYEKLPASLAGLTELVYDQNNQPAIRIIEELVERTGLTNRASQELLLTTVADADRKFFMNTPRVSGPGNVFARVPFASPLLDRLASMRTQAAPFGELAALFDAATLERADFLDMFTTTPPARKQPDYHGEAVRVRHFGHACVLIQSADVTILIDPMFTWDASTEDGRFTYADLPDRIDYLVISHCHQDHFSPEALVQLRHKVGQAIVPRNRTGSLADPSMELALRSLGYTDVRTVGAFDAVPVPGGEILSLPFTGEHADLDIYSKQTLLVRVNERRFFFLVDSDAINPALYRLVRDTAGRPDAVFVGMECNGAPLSWLYAPLMTRPLARRDDESRRLSASNSARAWKLLSDLGSRTAFIYAMGQEPWLRYVMGAEYAPDSIQATQIADFFARCREADITFEHLHIGKEMLF